MNLVIPLLEWSTSDFTELRFALRSFKLHLQYDKLVLIGPRAPAWLKNFQLIRFRDDPDPRFREANIYLKLKYYSDKHQEEPFLYANDDYFLLQQANLSYHWLATLTQSRNALEPGNPYRKTLNNTIELFPLANNYDVHYPMVVFPNLLNEMKADWKKPFGYGFKTLYVQYAHLEGGSKIIDYKVYRPDQMPELEKLSMTELTHFTMADQAVNDETIKTLKLLYPNKSKHE